MARLETCPDGKGRLRTGRGHRHRQRQRGVDGRAGGPWSARRGALRAAASPARLSRLGGSPAVDAHDSPPSTALLPPFRHHVRLFPGVGGDQGRPTLLRGGPPAAVAVHPAQRLGVRLAAAAQPAAAFAGRCGPHPPHKGWRRRQWRAAAAVVAAVGAAEVAPGGGRTRPAAVRRLRDETPSAPATGGGGWRQRQWLAAARARPPAAAGRGAAQDGANFTLLSCFSFFSLSFFNCSFFPSLLACT